MTNFEALKKQFERMTLEDVAEFLFEESCGKCAFEEDCTPDSKSCIEGHKRWLEQEETNG